MSSDENSDRSKKHPTRFAKGQCGNPKGRPKKKKAFKHILDREIPIEIDGAIQHVTLIEAALAETLRSALQDDDAAAKTFLKHSSKYLPEEELSEPHYHVAQSTVYPDVCDTVLLAIGAIRKSIPEYPSAGDDLPAYRLELWFLESALSRFRGKLRANEVDLIARSTVDVGEALVILARKGHFGMGNSMPRLRGTHS